MTWRFFFQYLNSARWYIYISLSANINAYGKNNISITYPSWELRDIVLLFKLTGHIESKQNKIFKKIHLEVKT